MQDTVNTDYIKAALNCVTTEKYRDYLRGVWISRRLGVIHYDATDGHVLFCGYTYAENDEGDFTVFVPTDLAKAIVAASPQLADISIGDTTKIGSVEIPETTMSPPSFWSVIPKKPNGEAAAFNPAILTRAAKALAKKPSSIQMAFNGDGPSIMTGALANAICVVMPLRNEPPTVDSVFFNERGR